MCLQKIKEFVVGQYQSYKDLSLERRVQKLQEAITDFKVSQRYHEGQVRFIKSDVLEIASRTTTAGGLITPAIPHVLVRVTVTGVYKDRVLAGVLMSEDQLQVDTGVYVYPIMGGIESSNGNEQTWLVSDYSRSRDFVLRMAFHGNMFTTLRYEWLA